MTTAIYLASVIQNRIFPLCEPNKIFYTFDVAYQFLSFVVINILLIFFMDFGAFYEKKKLVTEVTQFDVRQYDF